MEESAESGHGVPLEGSIPAAPLASILCTEELNPRPSRTPDCENENRALVKLVSALAKIQVSEREKAEAEVLELARGLEAQIRHLVGANVVGIIMWNLEPFHKHGKTERLHLEGAITGANDAFLRMMQYDREDLASGRLRWTDLTPAEWRGHDEQALADLKATGIFQPFEKEYFRKDGSRVPVLLGGALFEASGNDGVAFVLDLSDQKRTE